MLHSFRFLLSTLFILTSLTAGCTSAADATPPLPNRKAAAELIRPWISKTDPGVAVAVMQNGKAIFHKEAGLANLEHAVPITPETSFHAASLSKQFTAFSVLTLAVEGKLSLDDDIQLYLPEMGEAGAHVTIRHLLDHTGGLREQSSLRGMAGWFQRDVVTPQQMLRLLSLQRDVNFEPGAAVQYSNTGYGLLAEIVSRVSGEKFSAFTQKRIFTPLGMTQTSFRVDLSRIIPNEAQSYAPHGDGFSRLLLNFEIVGSTGLQTTPSDLLKWAENFETQKVGDPRVFDLMAERVVAENGEPAIYGRGQELRTYHGLQTWSHGGRDAGFRSFFLRVPERGFAVAVTANRSDFDMAKLAFDLTDVFLETEAETEKEWRPATAEELQAYSGDYELFSGLIFSISTDGQQLFFAPRNSPQKTPLPQIGERQFLLDPRQNISLEFLMDGTGKATAFNYVVSLNGKIKAPRIELAPFDPQNVELTSYEGVYYSEELEARYILNVSKGMLIAQHLRLPAISLTPYQPDTFSGSSSAFEKIVFERNASGAIAGCLVSGALSENVRFTKIR